MVVDLPAPFGPRKPKISPRATVSETWSTATKSPKRFTRFSVSTAVPLRSCGLLADQCDEHILERRRDSAARCALRAMSRKALGRRPLGSRNTCSTSPAGSTLTTPSCAEQRFPRCAPVSRPHLVALLLERCPQRFGRIAAGSAAHGASAPRGCTARPRPGTRW